MSMGKVYLVGAGPGDQDLLTVKAEKLIKSADVIVYDRLVESGILELAKPSVKLINVGKNVGHHPVPQDEINQILVDLANEYETIVRLKGGDPFVFGRGGEELEKLLENAVPFEVIPGITSSIAAACYAGIPVTHRDYCSSLHIITGHAKRGEEVKIDYDALVKLGGTLVFMMSVSSIGTIAKGLLASGMEKSMPCAVIENGTRSDQRKFVSTIAEIQNVIIENAVKSPAIILVGKVASLSEKLDWFSVKPLKNIRILSTQKAKNASKLLPRLKENGADITFCPTIQTTSTLPQSFDITKYSVITFSSIQGVESFFECLAAQNKDARALHGIKIACVGSQTAKSAKNRGICPDFVPEVFCGKSMAEGMIANGMLTNEDKILLVRPRDGSKEILEVLDANGYSYDDIPFYKTDYLAQKKIEDICEFDYITFTSKSGVESFVKSQSHLDFSLATAICIGDQTAETAIQYGFKVVVSDEATMNSMIDKIILLAKDKKGEQS